MKTNDGASPATALVACGVLRPELTHLQEQGKLEDAVTSLQ